MPIPVPSGASWFVPDILDLCQEAAERAGVDFTSKQALSSARMALDLMALEWANEGLNLWTIDMQVLSLQQGVATYSLPSDTMDLVYPMRRYIEADGITTRDLPMNRIDVTDYAAIPNKTYLGKPQQIYVDRQETPTVTVWPVPEDANHQVVYYRVRRINQTGAVTDAMDVPTRFIPAIVAGLAWRFSQKSRDPLVLQKVPMLKAEYRETFDKARYEDRQKVSTFIVPRVDW